MADEPMPLDDARLAEIRDRVEHQVAGQIEAEYLLMAYYHVLAENDELQAQMHVLRERAADMASRLHALRKIAETVAQDKRWVILPADDDRQYCMWCGAAHPDHQSAICPVVKARALLATSVNPPGDMPAE